VFVDCIRHVERMSADNWVSACREIEGSWYRYQTWQKCVTDDTRRLGVRRVAAQDRAVWRGAILGKRLTHANADNGNKNRRIT